MTTHLTSAQLMSQYMLRMKNASPTAWDDLVMAFDAYATEVTVAVTSAPQSEILVMQGRAQQCLALLRIMRECAHPKNAPPPQAQP